MRCRVLIILVFLVLGASVNLMATWACAVWYEPVAGASPDFDPTKLWTFSDSTDHVVYVDGGTPGIAIIAYEMWSYESRVGLDEDRSDRYLGGALPRWSQWYPGRAGKCEACLGLPNRLPHTHFEKAWGWPFSAMRLHVCEVRQRRHVIQYSDTVELGVVLGPWGYPRAIPLCPIWPGFALNAVLYGAVLWLLAIGRGCLRQQTRTSRGLCPKCKYPIGTSPLCTECGANVGCKKSVRHRWPGERQLKQTQ